MESDEQTELTHKIETDLDIENRLTALGAGDGGIQHNRKRTHGHEQQCGDCRGQEVGGGGRGSKEDK